MRRSSGFTLKEMLIVITSITVLLAILLPTMNGARQTAQRAKCLSNLKHLGYAFNNYACDNLGLAFPSSASGGQSWMTMLRSYASSPRVEGSASTKAQFMANICPTAMQGSADPATASGAGTSSLAWGNPQRTYAGLITPAEPLQLGDQMGSYGFNSSLATNIPNPPSGYFANPIGLIANSIDMVDTSSTNGQRKISGDAWVKGSAAVRNYAQISGRLVVGGSAGVSYSPTPINTSNNVVGGIFPVAPSSVTIPNVDAIHATLAARPDTLTMSSIPANATLDFTKNPVIRITGTAVLANITAVKGQGTLLLQNSGTLLPTIAWPFNIVTLGSVALDNASGKVALNGSIYAHNNESGNGTGRINGNLVTMGTYNDNDGPSFTAVPPPDFDTTTPRLGMGSTFNAGSTNGSRVPLFGDSIWPEAAPGIGALPATNTETGQRDSQLGRYYLNRHKNAVNLVFLDGHAETVALKNLSILKWTPQFPD